MSYIEITSLDDARLDAYARLTEAQLRNKLEPEKGIFIAESIKVIDRALAGGMRPVSVLMTPEWKEAAASTIDPIERAGGSRRFSYAAAAGCFVCVGRRSVKGLPCRMSGIDTHINSKC